jgi:MoxR-like ATPase
MTPTIEARQLATIQKDVPHIHASDSLVEYVQAILGFSREAPYYHAGLSPRAGLALLRGAQAWALMEGRDHVIPEDIQAVLPHVVRHRLQPAAEYRDLDQDELIQHICRVPIP